MLYSVCEIKKIRQVNVTNKSRLTDVENKWMVTADLVGGGFGGEAR